MEEINRHIVSRLKWDTTFDQKDEAYRLQERLSAWSKFSMPKEIMAIFNELCPPEQSWRIQSLEINLGNCDFNDLEFDLSRKLRSALQEKLSELIINQSTQNRIEVYNKEKSLLEHLTVFLIEGYLPWNYQNKEGSINQLMANLLLNNLVELIAIIKKAGITNEQVRKRIAYQFNEINVSKIIKALEPNNSSPIIEFATVITKLQTKETIVQTSTASFKKNLWFWILNYLLLERGTLFNKLAFMKSSMLQMANHYNIAYHDLLLLIENTIVKVSEKTKQHSDFILSLKTLTKEYAVQKSKKSLLITTTDYWSILEKLLKTSTERKSSAQKNNLNELILKLSNENSSKFMDIVARHTKTDSNCISLIQDINEVSIKIIFSKLDTTQSSLNFEAITYLKNISKALKLKINTKELWKIGIVYLIQNKNAKNTDFLLFCIKAISKKNQLEPEQLLELLTNVTIPPAIKNSQALEIFSNISTLYSDEIINNNSSFLPLHFENLLAKLEKQFNTTSNKNFKDLTRSFTKNSALQPKSAFEILVSYPNKEFLKKILPFILNQQLVQLLVNNRNCEKTELLKNILEVYEATNENEKYDLAEDLMNDDLLSIGLYEIIYNTKQSSSHFIENVLKQLSKKVTHTELKDFNHFITKLIESSKIKPLGLSIKNTFSNHNQAINPLNAIELGQFIQNNSKIAQLELALLLETHFDDFNFILLRKKDKIASENFINYFLKNGTTLKNSFTKQSTNRVENLSGSLSTSKIEDNLNVLFWKTILNYTAYKGNEIVFQKLLEAKFKLYLTSITEDLQNQSENTIQATPEKENDLKFNTIAISPETIELLNKLKANDSSKTNTITNSIIEDTKSNKKIEEWLSFIIYKKQIPALFSVYGINDSKDLLNQIIAKHPKSFIKIIKTEMVPEAQLDWLSRAVNFKNLCSAISVFDPNRESYLSILEKFYTALGFITISGIDSKVIQGLLFRKLIKAIANNNWKIISIQNIWNELIWEITTKKGVSKKSFLLDIEKQIHLLPLSFQLSLKDVLKNEKQTIQNTNKKELISKIAELKTIKTKAKAIKDGIAVRNAGIVILNSYIVMLLERLNLVSNNQFTSYENQINAVHYLQYVITGLCKTEEIYLPLNKVLCGLSLTNAVPDEIEIPEEKKLLIDGLIKAAISHWSVIGECSVNGFRGNWLVRDGLLVELEDKWELTVEKRAYDILISKSPFAFSIIKYHWMNKPLHVIWPY